VSVEEERLIIRLSQKLGEELRTLLEERHLYQTVKIDPKKIMSEGLVNVAGLQAKITFTHWVKNDLKDAPFVVDDHQSYAFNSAGKRASLTLIVNHVSLFCARCKRREAFAPLWFTDTIEQIRLLAKTKPIKFVGVPFSLQHIVLAYQCQRCIGSPETFLLKRVGWSLSLEGRSPIENIELPTCLPNAETKWYRDATVAFNSGKILAGLFYLRTFIEQFGRRVTAKDGKVTGDEIFDTYAATLPLALKDQMPSLREWYDKLSEAVP
jgi:hypothetical protein